MSVVRVFPCAPDSALTNDEHLVLTSWLERSGKNVGFKESPFSFCAAVSKRVVWQEARYSRRSARTCGRTMKTAASVPQRSGSGRAAEGISRRPDSVDRRG